jgi:hypothetical protein
VPRSAHTGTTGDANRSVWWGSRQGVDRLRGEKGTMAEKKFKVVFLCRADLSSRGVQGVMACERSIPYKGFFVACANRASRGAKGIGLQRLPSAVQRHRSQSRNRPKGDRLALHG